MIGKTFSHYEITALLGRGGMGEVYRARDTRLDREVALKLLPPEFAQDPERLARFRREARTLAGLNHPNIAAVHDFDEHEGQPFLTMELVEGEDLAQRLARGPVPLELAVDIARQVATGLEEAHEKGIVHRDLKPANLKITPEGQVKILDFGLARATLDEAAGETSLAHSPTITQNFTAAGTILGTAAYMSPEQARGHALDGRSDIWAFGCILFEMLAGRAAFGGDTVTDVLAGIVAREPDWERLPAGLPAPLRTLLWRCLQKDPRRRLRHIGEAPFYLDPPEEALALAAAATPPVPAGRGRWLAPTLVGIAIGALLGLLALRAFPGAGSREAAREVSRLSVPTGELRLNTFRDLSALALSPDGRTLVYSATPRSDEQGGPEAMLAIRSFSQRETRTIPVVATAAAPTFSPDGSRVAYYDFYERALMEARLDGGTPTRLARVGIGFAGAHWYEESSLLVAGADAPGLYRATPGVEEHELLLGVDASRGEATFSRPLVLSGAGLVLFTVSHLDGARPNQLACLDLRDLERTNLGLGDAVLGLLPNGDLAYLRGNSIFGQRFDTDGPSLQGPSRSLVEASGGNAALSPAGTLVYSPVVSAGAWEGRVFLVDGEGEVTDPLGQVLALPRYPRISPDGRYVVLTTGPGGQGTLWRFDLTRRSPPINLTFQAHNTIPVWSPDGSQILFERAGAGIPGWTLQLLASDGSELEPRLVDHAKLLSTGYLPGSWMENGKVIVTQDGEDAAGRNIYEIELGGDTTLRPLVATDFDEGNTVRASPDGRWLAYGSDRSGELEIWVQPYPQGPARRVSDGGGREPVWSRDGKRLYYQQRRKVVVVDVTYGGSRGIEFSEPRVFYGGPFVFHTDLTPGTYDAHPDGRLLMIERVDEADVIEEIHVVLNWFEEFRDQDR